MHGDSTLTHNEFEERLPSLFPDLVRYSRAMAGSKDDGDDVLQDALLKAWRSIDSLRDPIVLKPWLLRIIRNTMVSRTRTARFKRWVGLESVASHAQPSGLPFEDRELVRLALGKLPTAQREAVVMFEVLGMTVDEIATHQQASRSAVKSRLSRGRKRLRHEVEALNHEEKGHGHALAESA